MNFFLLFILSTTSHAFHPHFQQYIPPVDKCIAAFPLEYVIVKKIDKNTFEAVGSEFASPHAIIKAKKGMSLNQGRLNAFIKYKFSKKMEMSSGFEKEVDFWELCTIDEIRKVDKNLDEQMNKMESQKQESRKTKKGKSATCQDKCFKNGVADVEKCLLEACNK